MVRLKLNPAREGRRLRVGIVRKERHAEGPFGCLVLLFVDFYQLTNLNFAKPIPATGPFFCPLNRELNRCRTVYIHTGYPVPRVYAV